MTVKAQRGFTLMEVLVAILVIFMLMGLLIAGLHHVRKSGKGARDKAIVTSLNLGVSNFVREFGFLPPLVKDFDPVNPAGPIAQGSSNRIKIYSTSNPNDALFLRSNRPGQTPAYEPALPEGQQQVWWDLRFSQFSLPYFVAGALEVERTSTPGSGPIDGVQGPGFLTPKRDGTFEKSGRRFDSFFDLSRNGKALATINVAEGRVVVRDANDVPVRFYRWLQGDAGNNNQVISADNCNVPIILGRAVENPELRTAQYAILGAGPDGVFGDEGDIEENPFGHPVGIEAQQRGVGMTWDALAAKVGRPDPGTDVNARQRIRDLARKDNVIIVGSGK